MRPFMSLRDSMVVFATIGAIFTVFTISSCQHDITFMDDGGTTPIDTTGNGGGGGSNGTPCDPDVVYFESQILPILVSNCAMSGCHSAASHADGVVLTDYQRVIQTGKVRAFNPGNSELYEVITDNDSDDQMPPPPRARLTAQQIGLIADWIEQGAQNLSCDPNAGGCNLNGVTYNATVRPILQNACMGCHSGSAPLGGINLSTHAGVAAVALNGRLYGAINHAAGYSAMPQGGAKLAQCAIDQIKVWVDAGAPNN